MAASSGAIGQEAPAESFASSSFSMSSVFRYRVSRENGTYWMEFQSDSDPRLRGRKPLAYFIGSGTAARSYLLSVDGFLYQAPVAYYSNVAKWALAPNYDRYAYPYLTRPASPGCLNCHASFVDVISGTQNRYAPRPFAEGGVACERCHGPGESHIQKMRVGNLSGGSGIINPAKLAPDLRDSVCGQCHLAGEVRVMRQGATWNSYRAGERLADSLTVFIRSGANSAMRVTSHFDNLAQSACKRASRDRLWCGSCHDPHALPGSAQRVAWFRRKCLECHFDRRCKETQARRATQHDDCIACHMPEAQVTDAQHVVFTDHSIPRRPRTLSAPPAADAELVPFGGGGASPRDLALAYGIAASERHAAADLERARRLLERAAIDSPDDSEVLLYLAEIYRTAGQPEMAIPLYRRAMRLDPAQVTASAGLGAILFERGQFDEAIRLWRDALSKNAGLVLTGTDLAMAQWRTGDRMGAESTLRGIIELSPAFRPARELLQRLQAAPPQR
jgi:hypothetical protein